MKLLTKEVVSAFPKGKAKNPNNPQVIVKFFATWGAATWWATEYNAKDRLFFGFAYLGDEDCAELGYFSLDELEQASMPLVIGGRTLGEMKVERDAWFTRQPLADALRSHGLNEAASRFDA